MKLGTLAIKFFKQHWLANGLIIGEIIFTLFISTVMINRTSYIFETYLAIKDTPIENAIYFMGRDGAETTNSFLIEPYMEELQEQLSQLDGIAAISSIGQFNTVDGDIVIAYDKTTASFLHQETNGEWLEPDNDSGIVVYGSNQEIGNKVTLDVQLYNQYTYEESDEFESEVRSKEFEVIGTCESLSDTLLYSTTKANTTVNLDRFIWDSEYYSDFTVYFIPAENAIFDGYTQSTDSMFLYLEEDISQEQLDAINVVLDQYGTHMYGRDILELTYEDNIDSVVYDISTFLSIALIVVISLLSIAFLNIKKFASYISVYYMNGCSFKKAMCIYFIYLAILLVTSFVCFTLYLLYINYHNSMNKELYSTLYIRTYELHAFTQQISAGFILLLLVIESFVPFYVISRKSKIHLLKDYR